MSDPERFEAMLHEVVRQEAEGVDVEVKRCARCRSSNPVSDFHSCRKSPDGLRSWCKPCQRQATQIWRAANRDELLARRRRQRAEGIAR